MQKSMSVTGLMEDAMETSETPHFFSVEEKEAEEVQEQTDRGQLAVKNAGLQRLFPPPRSPVNISQ